MGCSPHFIRPLVPSLAHAAHDLPTVHGSPVLAPCGGLLQIMDSFLASTDRIPFAQGAGVKSLAAECQLPLHTTESLSRLSPKAGTVAAALTPLLLPPNPARGALL